MTEQGPEVELRPVDRGNVDAILQLTVAPRQALVVASAAVSLAQAHYEPGAWVRAICQGDRPVGLVVVFDPRHPDAEPDPILQPGDILLWRLLVDRSCQGKGYGQQAVMRVLEQFSGAAGLQRLLATYPPGPHAPVAFFEGLGFTPTGQEDEGEIVVARPLLPGADAAAVPGTGAGGRQ
ncbi:MAG: GNAT family N-acetyltransferase [Sneathiellaceae bacterium]